MYLTLKNRSNFDNLLVFSSENAGLDVRSQTEAQPREKRWHNVLFQITIRLSSFLSVQKNWQHALSIKQCSESNSNMSQPCPQL